MKYLQSFNKQPEMSCWVLSFQGYSQISTRRHKIDFVKPTLPAHPATVGQAQQDQKLQRQKNDSCYEDLPKGISSPVNLYSTEVSLIGEPDFFLV